MVAGITRCVLAGGCGQVGRMFAKLLAGSGVHVVSVDLAGPGVGAELEGVRYLSGDIAAPRARVLEEVAAADLVLLAVPERVALAAVGPLTSAMRPKALLADTLSAKSRYADLVCQEVHGLELVSLNPMFAPAFGIEGRSVAVVTIADGPRAHRLRELLAAWGAHVVPVAAADHDRLTAALQTATHGAVLAFGIALYELGTAPVELLELAPPPHLAMMCLLARISSGIPEVYWDVQAGNPEAAAARAALRRGIDRLEALAARGDESGFAALLTDLREFLGSEQSSLAELCARMLERLPPTPLVP